MRTLLIAGAIALIAAFTTPQAHALGKKDKGCLVGGAAGGVGGHLLGDHAVLGAVGGCAVGAVVADKNDKKQQAEKKRREQVARSQSRARRDRDRELARDHPPS